MPNTFIRDPQSVLDYTIDWTDWLDGDTITTSTWVVPTGITEDDSSNTTTAAEIWVSGGTVGTTYRLTNRITTAAGRTDDRTIRIQVQDR